MRSSETKSNIARAVPAVCLLLCMALSAVPDSVGAGAGEVMDQSPPDVGRAAVVSSQDCNSNGVDDFTDIAGGTSEDCNSNGIPDECDIADGRSLDCNSNGAPDECETDCNRNGIADECEMEGGPPGQLTGRWRFVFRAECADESCEGFDELRGAPLEDFVNEVRYFRFDEGNNLVENVIPIPESFDRGDGLPEYIRIVYPDDDGPSYLMLRFAGTRTEDTDRTALTKFLPASGALFIEEEVTFEDGGGKGGQESRGFDQEAGLMTIEGQLDTGSGDRITGTWTFDADEPDSITLRGSFVAARSGDCNGDGVLNDCEPDCDGNATPDACEDDCDGNGAADVCELLFGAVGADHCVDAMPVCPDGIIRGSTIGATNDAESGKCLDDGDGPDSWFLYVPATDGQLTIDLCGSDYDTGVVVHSGCPATLGNEIACDEDDDQEISDCFNWNDESFLSMPVTAGEHYYIRITGDDNDDVGTFLMKLTGPECAGGPAKADDCNGNEQLDSCDIVSGNSSDCNGNDVPDECDTTSKSWLVASSAFSDLAHDSFFLVDPLTGRTRLVGQIGTDEEGGTLDIDIDPTTGVIYAAETSEDPQFVFTVDPLSGDGTPLPQETGEDLLSIAFGPNGTLFAAGQPDDADNIFVLSKNSGAVIENRVGTAIVPDDVAGLAAHPNNGTLFANSQGFVRRFYLIEGNTGTLLAELPMIDEPGRFRAISDVAYDPNGTLYGTANFMIASHLPSDLVTIDAATGTILSTIGSTRYNLSGLGGAYRPAPVSEDCNVNRVPDECEADCNENGIPDGCDIETGASRDLNLNGIPDECDVPVIGGGGGGGGGPGCFEELSCASVIDVNGEFFRVFQDRSGHILGSLLISGAAPGATVEWDLFDSDNGLNGAPGPDGGTTFGFPDGIGIGRTLTITTSLEPGTFIAVVTIRLTAEELAALGLNPEDLQLYELDEALDPPTWVPAGTNYVGESTPTGVVGDMGYFRNPDGSFTFWVVRDELSDFSIGGRQVEEPGGEEPGGEVPGGEEPGGEVPGGEEPGGEEPGQEEPGGETPEPGGPTGCGNLCGAVGIAGLCAALLGLGHLKLHANRKRRNRSPLRGR